MGLCWHSATVSVPVRTEHRTNAAEHGMTVAHHILNPDAPRSFICVPYFWSDQYETKIQRLAISVATTKRSSSKATWRRDSCSSRTAEASDWPVC